MKEHYTILVNLNQIFYFKVSIMDIFVLMLACHYWNDLLSLKVSWHVATFYHIVSKVDNI